MDPLPPIPTPPAQRWREFRIQILPLIVFVVVIVLVAFLWRSFVQPIGVVGEVEAIKANMTSPEDGLIVELNVDLLQPVKVGQVIGRVQVQGDEAVRAQLAALETELRVTGVQTLIAQQRRAQDLEQFKMDLMEQKTSLAGDQADLIQASNNFFRVKTIYLTTTNIYSPTDYDLAERDFMRFKALVQFRQDLVTEMSKSLEDLSRKGSIDIQSSIENDIKSHQQELQTLAEPVVLRAPIDGTVSSILRRSGERVRRGEIFLTISAPQSDRIVGYLRPPFTTVPTTNDTVVITTRSQPRRKGEGQILQVGTQIELVRPGLLSPDANRIESGLPFLIRIPADMEMVPGELVDLSIRYASN